ncbi:Neprilysin-2 [Aphelenchoides besseyi]|nr:Neprilysin-2 [Aphelenchoides besseyi]
MANFPLFVLLVSYLKVYGQAQTRVFQSAQNRNHAAAEYLLRAQDPTIDPCTNFYKFQCKGWEKRNPIPESDEYISRYTQEQQKVNRQLQRLLSQPTPRSSPDDAIGKARFAYRSCLDEKALERDEVKTLKSELNYLGGWPLVDPKSSTSHSYDLTDLLIKLQKIRGKQFLFTTTVERDLENSTRFAVYFQVASPSLRVAEFYLNKTYEPVIKGYARDMQKLAELVAELLRLPIRKKEFAVGVKEMVGFDRELATIAFFDNSNQLDTNSIDEKHEENSAQLHQNTLKTRLSALKTYMPLIDWNRWTHCTWPKELYGFLDSNPEIFIEQPGDFAALTKLLKKTNPLVVRNYIIAVYIWNRAINFGPRFNEIVTAVKLSQPQPSHRDERVEICVAAVSDLLPDATSALYVREYFNSTMRKQMDDMIVHVKQTFAKIINENTWMDPETKKYALEKLQSTYVHNGFAPNILNERAINAKYDNIQFGVTDNFDRIVRKSHLARWERELRKLLRHTTPDDSSMAPTEINAFYDQSNIITIPLAYILSFFNPSFPSAMIYGSIGFTLGHELSHGFDENGSQYDKNGNIRRWWKDTSYKHYLNRTACLVDEYNQFYEPHLNMYLNGKLTLDENIADLSGLQIAYRAFKENPREDHSSSMVPGLEQFSSEQIFFMAFAAAECTNERDSELTLDILSESHSIEPFRVNGVLSNFPAFARAFQCSATAPLNPKKRCSIWT